MTDKNYETKVINLRRKRLVRRYKALFDFMNRITELFKRHKSKIIKSKNYRRTMNH